MTTEHQNMQMQNAMLALDRAFNPGMARVDRKMGIVLLVFPFGSGGRQARYISNGADRKAMIALLREAADRFEEQARQEGHG